MLVLLERTLTDAGRAMDASVKITLKLSLEQKKKKVNSISTIAAIELVRVDSSCHVKLFLTQGWTYLSLSRVYTKVFYVQLVQSFTKVCCS